MADKIGVGNIYKSVKVVLYNYNTFHIKIFKVFVIDTFKSLYDQIAIHELEKYLTDEM